MKRFAPFADGVLPWLTLTTMIAALVMVFLYVPNERVQGVVQRIFYFHLPAAWNTFLGFFIVAGASASASTGAARRRQPNEPEARRTPTRAATASGHDRW